MKRTCTKKIVVLSLSAITGLVLLRRKKKIIQLFSFKKRAFDGQDEHDLGIGS